MKRLLLSCLTIVMCLGFMQAAAPESGSGKPEYTSDNHLLPPKNFREWIFLSSGLGMSYSPGSMDHQMFTNVFVPQWAYSEFVKSWKWPNQSIRERPRRGWRSAPGRELCFSLHPPGWLLVRPPAPRGHRLQYDCPHRNSPLARRRLRTCPPSPPALV